jgi:hypothetical protein
MMCDQEQGVASVKDERFDALIGSADVSDPPLPDNANHGTHNGSAPRKSARNRHRLHYGRTTSCPYLTRIFGQAMQTQAADKKKSRVWLTDVMAAIWSAQY